MEKEFVQDPLVAAARQYAERKWASVSRPIRTRAGIRRMPFIQYFERAAELLQEMGFGPRVLAANYLQLELAAEERKRLEEFFDADVAHLQSWVRMENEQLPVLLREAMYVSKLRAAPPTALAIVAARSIANLESIAGLTSHELERGMLYSCGWQLFEPPCSERLRSLRQLEALFARRLPPSLFHYFTERLREFELYTAWEEGREVTTPVSIEQLLDRPPKVDARQQGARK